MLQHHINPDHYLLGPDGRRVWSEERGKAAWELAYAELERSLQTLGPRGTLYIVCGLQGAGKSTWIERNGAGHGPTAIFFDAALPSRKHRVRALALAAASATPAVAVWINVPIETALARNALRSGDERIAEETIRHVLGLLEAPSVDEGFRDVIEIND
jgi:predicted kinase